MECKKSGSIEVIQYSHFDFIDFELHVRTGSRIASLALLWSPLAVLAPVAYMTGPNTKSNQLAWDYAVWSIEKAGPTFTKLIQWATTRNDIFSTVFIEHFVRLQDNTLGHTWSETQTLMEASYGKDYLDLFEFESGKPSKDTGSMIFTKKKDKILPIGSGCIAQGTLKRDCIVLCGDQDCVIFQILVTFAADIQHHDIRHMFSLCNIHFQCLIKKCTRQN